MSAGAGREAETCNAEFLAATVQSLRAQLSTGQPSLLQKDF